MIIINAINNDPPMPQPPPSRQIDELTPQNISELRPTEPVPNFNEIKADDSDEINDFEDTSSIQQVDDDLDNEAKEQDSEAPFPYQEAEKALSIYDDVNKTYTISQKIDLSLSGDQDNFPGVELPIPLKITYLSRKGKTTERIILPEYIHSVKTVSAEGKNDLLVAWWPGNGWRKFIINSPTAGIKEANLVEEKSANSLIKDNNQEDGERND